jgi:histidine decarboxylase
MTSKHATDQPAPRTTASVRRRCSPAKLDRIKDLGASRPILADQALAIGREPADQGTDIKGLLRWVEALGREQPRSIGFPGALDFSYQELAPVLDVLVNNVGDPESSDASAVSAKQHELAVVRFLAETAGADPDDIYGYVAGGGVEGIERGLELARERLPHAPVYVSDQAHYAVRKVAERLRMKLVNVPSRPGGEMDPAELRLRVTVRGHLGRVGLSGGRRPGAIILATTGSTFRGAYDNVAALRRAASSAGALHVHVDAAMGGLIAAHAPSRPSWSFADGADSISVSGHKVLGMPVPCSAFLARRDHVGEGRPGAEYVGATDRTWGCSRSGLAVLLLWARLRSLGHDGLRERVGACLDVASYAAEQLAQVEGAAADRVTDSIVVTVNRPAEWVVDRWHLAVEGGRAHMVCVSHVTRATVDRFRDDLARGYAA